MHWNRVGLSWVVRGGGEMVHPDSLWKFCWGRLRGLNNMWGDVKRPSFNWQRTVGGFLLGAREDIFKGRPKNRQKKKV